MPNTCISYITKFINTTESFLFFGANVQNFLDSLWCYIVGNVLLHYNVPVRRFITLLYIQKDANLRVTVTNEIHELWSPTNRQWRFHSNLTNKPNIYIYHMFSFIFGGYHPRDKFSNTTAMTSQWIITQYCWNDVRNFSI